MAPAVGVVMRVVVQKAIVQVIQPEIVKYICDKCGAVCGTKDNPKEVWYGEKKRKHYCKKTCGGMNRHAD
jgi:hypothetical protein